MYLSELSPDLWIETLQYCSKHELTRTSLVNSTFLEISRDFLYHAVLIRSESFFRTLTSLRNPLLYQRLRYLILDFSSIDEILTSDTQAEAGILSLEVLLTCLGSSNLKRLDITTRYTYQPSIIPILMRFIQLPSLSYIKFVLTQLKIGEVQKVLQASALKGTAHNYKPGFIGA
ncbi:hypothetical protein DL96DRAFT_397147 [Flagelloscypha sp. PMI_526]|nr:hypothetical protein DL96DRAFT_397147 [Flagelloscypha sp. PMI_526]